MRLWPALAMCAAMAVVVAADGVPTVVTYVPHDKVTATMARGGSIIDDHASSSWRSAAARVKSSGTSTPTTCSSSWKAKRRS